ncbi:diaminopimelate decarboxylase [Clostridium sporogenes]|uniref:diaminopimelate decarboxylase n=1 Tax=Clostridium sporogenes TaxID=1509 RepID=UPI0013CF593C|nr:diaminopimelate decarboxylase [Clostridium sporogenes]NFG95685.1 diaminopimelate decarboxylase [Clostridium sporogenes]
MKLFGSMNIKNNNLYIGKINTLGLATEFGTPLYVMDETLIRDNCRRYVTSFNKEKNKVAYAGKAFLTKAMCNLIKEEGLYLDVVSGGEIFTAYKSGFPMEKVYFHGNNKTIEEIEMAINLGVGTFVADNFQELDIIDNACKNKNIKQRVILRIIPGIEAHTHEYIKTGQIDSKFGFTLIDNGAIKAVKKAYELENIQFVGFHCHIGSQIFETKPYEEEIEIMLKLIKRTNKELNIDIEELDLGGGFGIYYKDGDKPKEIEEFCKIILDKVKNYSKEIGVREPVLIIEPGRSIVGNSGVTLYSVGSIKEIPNVAKYVAVNGGMTDNIRPALYKSEYECVVCNKALDNLLEEVKIVGKCCESGDVLINNVKLPIVETNDLFAILNTGDYGYSMASNYNKALLPSVVFVNNDKVKLVCRRQSYENLIQNEV